MGKSEDLRTAAKTLMVLTDTGQVWIVCWAWDSSKGHGLASEGHSLASEGHGLATEV